MKRKDLPKQCQSCVYLNAISVYMNGDGDYGCGRYPICWIIKSGNECPEYEEDTEYEVH